MILRSAAAALIHLGQVMGCASPLMVYHWDLPDDEGEGETETLRAYVPAAPLTCREWAAWVELTRTLR
jgi:hypothetical protein